MVGLKKKKKKKKKTVTYTKISPKMVNPRDIAGQRTRRRRNNWEENVYLVSSAKVLTGKTD